MTQRINLAMLIDDNEIDQRYYSRVINSSGLVAELQTFTYADDALAHLERNTDVLLDIIFLDINMPRMNGFEFLEAATQRLGSGFAKVVVVMLTTSANPDDRARAESYEVVKKFVTKPLIVEHIAEAANLLPDVNR